MNFTFDPKKHLYELDGKPMTGVTTILSVIAKPALIQWAANEAVKYIEEHSEHPVGKDYQVSVITLTEAKTAHRKKKEDAGSKGTDVHKEVEGLIQDGIDNNNGYIFGQSDNEQVKKFIDWATENKVKFLASEKQVYSEIHWLAGTLDFLCVIN